MYGDLATILQTTADNPVEYSSATTSSESDERTAKRFSESLNASLDDEQLFRLVYVPFVIARLVWDYAETVVDIAAQLRLDETKPLSREVRNLRRDYDRMRQPYIDMEHRNSEVNNMYKFEAMVDYIVNQMLVNLKIDINREYPDTHIDYINLMLAVNQCDIALKSLIIYSERQAILASKQANISLQRIMPIQIYRLNELIPKFIADKPASAGFLKQKKTYIDILANKIALVKMNRIYAENPDDE